MATSSFIKRAALGAFAAAVRAPAFAQDAPVRIGYAISRSGPFAPDAQTSQEPNYVMWAEQVNAAGGLNVKGKKRKVELVGLDDRSEVETMVRTYEKLFYKPTVLEDVRPGMRVLAEEVFGPVIAVVPFDSDEEAIRINNATEYGLSTGVITQSLERAMEVTAKLKTGIVHINDQTVGDEPSAPFGGRGASGDGGRHGGPANWEEFTQWQWVTIQDRATPYPF